MSNQLRAGRKHPVNDAKHPRYKTMKPVTLNR